jgi:hypothetical protein
MGEFWVSNKDTLLLQAHQTDPDYTLTVYKKQYIRIWQVLHINLSTLQRPCLSEAVNTLTSLLPYQASRATVKQEGTAVTDLSTPDNNELLERACLPTRLSPEDYVA